MSIASTSWLATDEDIVIKAPGDYTTLCPKDQVLAKGTDGVFAANSWDLTSASINFASQGVATGNVVQLTKTNVFANPAELLVISSVATNTATLRRKGLAAAVGQPPGPAAGTTGVTFTVTTFGPQIEDATYELWRRFGIDTAIAGRTPSDLYDVREARQACVFTVLKRLYAAQARQAGSNADDFWAKYRAMDAELTDTLDRLVIHWSRSTGYGATAESTPVTRFGTRLTR